MKEEKNSQGNTFNIEATTFQLTVTYKCNKLVLALKDYIGWAIYQREYMQGSHQQEIHKKVDLQDIYYSLLEGIQVQDKTNKMNGQSEVKEIFQYKFGDIVGKKGFPYFKVEENGRITVFVSIINQRNEKQEIYESNLQLIKQRVMTQVDIEKRKFFLEKQQLLKEKEELFKKISIVQKQNSRLAKIIENDDQKKQLSEKLNQKEQEIKQHLEMKQEFIKKINILIQEKQKLFQQIQWEKNQVEALKKQLEKSLKSQEGLLSLNQFKIQTMQLKKLLQNNSECLYELMRGQQQVRIVKKELEDCKDQLKLLKSFNDELKIQDQIAYFDKKQSTMIQIRNMILQLNNKQWKQVGTFNDIPKIFQSYPPTRYQYGVLYNGQMVMPVIINTWCRGYRITTRDTYAAGDNAHEMRPVRTMWTKGTDDSQSQGENWYHNYVDPNFKSFWSNSVNNLGLFVKKI